LTAPATPNNTYTGTTTISVGTLRAASNNALGATAGGVTVASGAALEVTGGIAVGAKALTLSGTGSGSGALVNVAGDNTFAGAITLGADTTIGSSAGSLTLTGSGIAFGGNALTFDGAGDITLAIALGGAAGFTKTGAGTLTLGTAMNTTGTITLAGGTLDLGGFNQTIGTLQVTGDSILDFSGTSTFNLTTLNISSGVTLTVVNWVDAVDYFYGANNPGATVLNRVVFSGFSASNTSWLGSDHQITPVPEPSTYGAAFLGLALALYGWRRARVSSRSKSA
jgi:autotransporter-associated beta strand protein